MFSKRLFSEVEKSRKYILLNVLSQWISLICNIGSIYLVTNWINDLLQKKSTLQTGIYVLIGLLVKSFSQSFGLVIFCISGLVFQPSMKKAKLITNSNLLKKHTSFKRLIFIHKTRPHKGIQNFRIPTRTGFFIL